MVWPVSSDKWKAPFMCEFAVFLFLLGLTIFLFFIFFLFVVIQFFLYLECSIRLDLKRSFNWIEKNLSLKFYYILKSVEGNEGNNLKSMARLLVLLYILEN